MREEKNLKESVNSMEDASSFRFNSEELPVSERYAYWEDMVCSYLSPTNNRLLTKPDDFLAQLCRTRIGKMNVCRLNSSPLHYNRSKEMISKLPNDDIFIAVLENGKGYIEQYGRQAICTAGDIVIYDSGNPFSWRLTEMTQMTVAMIPRNNIETILPNLERITCCPIRRDNITASLISTNIFEFINLHLPHGTDSYKIEKSFSFYLSAALDIAFSDNDQNHQSSKTTYKAKKYIKDNFEDPQLNIDSIAQHVGVSKRTLARTFATEGTSPMRWLWEQRLSHAFSLLKCSGIETVSQVAMMCGFSDFSHFTRTFKAKYGVLPKMLLKHDLK